MLGKLLKYEFKATGRTLLPLYGVVLALSIINKIFIGTSNGFFQSNAILALVQVIVLIGYVFMTAAAAVGTIIIIIQRFYKNLLKDEGYLMNTLPVSTSLNIWSKLIAAVVWNIVCAIVILLSVAILFANGDVINAVKECFTQLPYELERSGLFGQINLVTFTLELLLMIIVGSAQNIMMFYLSMAIGHLSNQRKVLCSFGAYIGINVILNMVGGILVGILGFNNNKIVLNNLVDVHSVNLIACAGALIITAILFVICNKILKDNLNLE